MAGGSRIKKAGLYAASASGTRFPLLRGLLGVSLSRNPGAASKPAGLSTPQEFSSIQVSHLWLPAEPVARRLENKGALPSLETWA